MAFEERYMRIIIKKRYVTIKSFIFLIEKKFIEKHKIKIKMFFHK